MILLTEFIIILIAAGLMFHAWRLESQAYVLAFWGGGAVLGLLRELVVVKFTPLYTYGDFTLMILGVPIIMILFWSNFTYIAMRWTENILDRSFTDSPRVDDQLPLIFLVMAAIAIAVEAYASQFGMIVWKAEPVLTLWGDTPAIVPFGYGAMGVLYALAFRGVWLRVAGSWRQALLYLAVLSPVIILMQLGFLLVVKVLIGLSFSA